MNWDQRFLDLARSLGQWSKDPSTKCGCVIVRPDKTIVSQGFNGFPRGMEDRETRYQNRPDKYARVIHAELNALLFARESLNGCTLYCSFPTCHRCAVCIIQAGITRVVFPKLSEADMERWGEQTQLAMNYYEECGVRCDVV